MIEKTGTVDENTPEEFCFCLSSEQQKPRSWYAPPLAVSASTGMHGEVAPAAEAGFSDHRRDVKLVTHRRQMDAGTNTKTVDRSGRKTVFKNCELQM